MNDDNKIIGYVTDPHDRQSLEFFLTADREELRAWNAIASEHDIAYASSLMKGYAKELELIAFENLIELQLETEHPNYTTANLVIDRIRYSA